MLKPIINLELKEFIKLLTELKDQESQIAAGEPVRIDLKALFRTMIFREPGDKTPV